MFNNSTPFTMPVTPAYATNGGGFGNGFGSDWIGLIVILAILGWGNGGFGGFGGGNGGYSEVQRGFDHNSVINKLDGLTYGLSDSTYALTGALNTGFNGVQQTLCQGFNGISREIADCCCSTKSELADVKYQMATQACDTRNLIQSTTRDIIDGQNANTRAILDFLTTDKIASLQAENQALKFKASQAEQNAFITANQNAQTAELIRRLGADCPTPAYLVPNPNCCYNAQVSFGNGCGCGSY